MTAGRLVLAATPIGDVDDASPRLRRLLAEADVIAAEDTRRLRALVARMDVQPTGRLLSYHEHNEAGRAEELLDVVRGGGTVLLVTDAGMPTISDPGFRVVVAAVAAGIAVTAVPGPSAVLTALAVSGLPTDRFCFEGFPSRRAGERARQFAGLANEPRTMVFFEAPHRLAETLAAMAAAWGADRPAAVCRELTKTYEEVVRGPLAELVAWSGSGPVRGEITVVVAGAAARDVPSIGVLVAEVLVRVDAGERLKERRRRSPKRVVCRGASSTRRRSRHVPAAAAAAERSGAYRRRGNRPARSEISH